jgi:hypothetical protein
MSDDWDRSADAEHYIRCKQRDRGDWNAVSPASSGRNVISRLLIRNINHDGRL